MYRVVYTTMGSREAYREVHTYHGYTSHIPGSTPLTYPGVHLSHTRVYLRDTPFPPGYTSGIHLSHPGIPQGLNLRVNLSHPGYISGLYLRVVLSPLGYTSGLFSPPWVILSSLGYSRVLFSPPGLFPGVIPC